MLKREVYESIERGLQMVAINRRVLMEIMGEDKSEIDKFIAEFGGDEIKKIEEMSRGEFMVHMIDKLLDDIKELGD
jgi:hypothetical protein